MRDLQSKRWIIAKGVAFLGIAVATAALLLNDAPTPRTAVLLALLVWSASRFYYFLFYVLERYVDPRLRYSGIAALVRATVLRRKSRTSR
jgi:hypothetical protein